MSKARRASDDFILRILKGRNCFAEGTAEGYVKCSSSWPDFRQATSPSMSMIALSSDNVRRRGVLQLE